MDVGVDLNAPENLSRHWTSVQTELINVVQAQASDALPVIGIDELPLMLQNLMERNVATAELLVLLSGLRKLRDAGLRLVIGGSISTENLLTLLEIPHSVLGGLWREDVLPFTYEQAQTYLERELRGSTAVAAIPHLLSALPDYVPEFLRIAVTFLADLDQAARAPWVIQNQILPAIQRMFLEQFNERLAAHFKGEQLVCAQALLDQIAQQPPTGGRIDTTGLLAEWRLVMNKLMFDNFVREAPELGYAFTLNMLRQWWRAQRGMA